MMNEWQIWLDQNPAFSFAGKDSDGDAVEDFGEDYEGEEDGDTSEFNDNDRKDFDDDSGDKDDTSRRIRRLESDNKKLARELEAAVELLNQASDYDSGEAPEGFVPQEDYDSLVDLLRTDYIEHAIAKFYKKDGSPRWDWEDPSAVYKFLDVDELEVDVKTKTIDGLEDQLADIAERYPFMLKNGKRREGNGSTGKPPRKSGAREHQTNPSLEALVAEFPALVD